METTQTRNLLTRDDPIWTTGDRLRVLARESVYHPGTPSTAMYLVEEGRVKLSYLHPSGKRITLALRGPGEVFGQMAIVGEKRRRHHAEALEDTELVRVEKDAFLLAARQRPEVYSALLGVFGLWVQELEEIVEDLAFRDIQTRLSRQLLRLSNEYGVKTKSGIMIGFRLTHRDLAEMIGSARENTTVVLNRFEREGILDKRRYQIVIKDLEGLKEKCQS
ncbi:MAG TPA: Crp/Fnr family transcriptional regulator [Candidatus Bipolaricaulis anaerobius]|nr:Crp/Fnr family transcriptional regulator [Candidatus Bipolaricaulis anaerobius]HNS23514.1 Crp/Fnr family transcriptional regulator [Candidatus Bipolaricaulis anaerobius]